MTNEWVEWHEGYAAGQPLAERLVVVQRMLSAALDTAPAGPIRLLSMCAGDGRDVLGVLPSHPRRDDVDALLVELDPTLSATARERAATTGLRVNVVTADAGTTSAYANAAPADVLLVCGVFGNISDADVRNTITHLPALCAPAATVIWTRGTFEPDLTPTIREWFASAGFRELEFVSISGTTVGVGAHRLVAQPAAFVPDVSLFSFLEPSQRPSRRGPPGRRSWRS